MEKERLVAFTDGVIAVIITIMVLELKAPHETDLAALWTSLPVFLSYALSFVYVGVYWVNHIRRTSQSQQLRHMLGSKYIDPALPPPNKEYCKLSSKSQRLQGVSSLPCGLATSDCCPLA